MSDYFVHETSVVDDNVVIGEGTKIWHFSHIQSGAVIGKNCSLGQNVNVSNNVRIGDGCKLQNNVSWEVAYAPMAAETLMLANRTYVGDCDGHQVVGLV